MNFWILKDEYVLIKLSFSLLSLWYININTNDNLVFPWTNIESNGTCSFIYKYPWVIEINCLKVKKMGVEIPLVQPQNEE